ncbi:MAG: 5'-nucleotidase C-terminal domain-containing protein [Bacteroidales bacterium]|nr:5'-nucleotidase C-terminal domain-containing protein [Bacteroidales bacterium]MDD2424843.1 5'-nucleotidase C-terminal domain-containing protein [Bacteroidales bacterium]MDD3989973.1 5'-nucleotidase C-terminal domain-containing protein [Bacteroidales bacterium]MDD4639014.1 5'-nucleotidase C-terminal domain-containing protein [Bacteroidales bacterium]
MKRLFTLLILTCLISTTNAQQVRFKWKAKRVLMDSTWNKPEEPRVKAIIDYYKPEMDRLMQQKVGESAREMRSGRPESLLSNFAVDAILDYSRKQTDKEVHFSLTNFGGIRSTLPAGDVRRYDIFSIFPFENYLVVIDLRGSSVKKLFNTLAKRVEALSGNVKLVIEGENLTQALIDGVQVDESKIYRVATLDFLLDGGDNMSALSEALLVEQTGVLIRDAIFAKIEELTAGGNKIDYKLDGRVLIK